MLEKECIQSKGFRNILEDGKIVGFQVKVRSLYYRGLWLSQIRSNYLEVDGIRYDDEDIIWVINGKEYEQKNLKNYGDVHWGVLELATLKVKTANGLSSGYHDVVFDLKFSSSYLPPMLDTILSGPENRRRLIIV